MRDTLPLFFLFVCCPLSYDDGESRTRWTCKGGRQVCLFLVELRRKAHTYACNPRILHTQHAGMNTFFVGLGFAQFTMDERKAWPANELRFCSVRERGWSWLFGFLLLTVAAFQSASRLFLELTCMAVSYAFWTGRTQGHG